MTRRRAVGGLLGVAGALVFRRAPAGAQGASIHGERDVFASAGLVIAWAVLQGATEETTQVVVRVAVIGEAYRHVAVDGVDPFTRARRRILPSAPSATTLDVRSPRASFADFPRREIRLYRTMDELARNTPGLTVYYLGVPDTTPEFTSEAALVAYLAEAVARALRRRRAPGLRYEIRTSSAWGTPRRNLATNSSGSMATPRGLRRNDSVWK
jgi:hypothetical protein